VYIYPRIKYTLGFIAIIELNLDHAMIDFEIVTKKAYEQRFPGMILKCYI